ncbi:MAG: hypothetical protein ACFFDI_05875 [Promethearchaeota archaeon]
MYHEEKGAKSSEKNQQEKERIQLTKNNRFLVVKKLINPLNSDFMKKWLQSDFTTVILMGLAIFIVEVLLGIFYDTTVHWDAWTRAQGVENFIAVPLLEWIPFIPNVEALPGMVWLPGHFYIVALLHLFTKIPILYLGEILSAASTAGISCYLFLILKQDLDLPQKRAILVSLLPLTSGVWVSHGSQFMTDLFSYLLLIATLFHFSKFIIPNNSRKPYLHGLIGTLLATFNNFTRYEPWVLVSGIVGLLFLISILLQIRILARREGWVSSLIQIVIQFFKPDKKEPLVQIARRCVLFIILPASAIILWLVYSYAKEGTFFYTTEWILAHNEDWGWVQQTTYNLPGTIFIFFAHLNEATPFWWLIPLSLLVFMLKSNETEHLSQPQNLWYFVIWGITIIFSLQMMMQMFSGVSTSEVRFFMTLIPFATIAFGFLSQHPRFRSNWLLAGLLGIGFLNSVLSLQILHIRHLYQVQHNPEFVKP